MEGVIQAFRYEDNEIKSGYHTNFRIRPETFIRTFEYQVIQTVQYKYVVCVLLVNFEALFCTIGFETPRKNRLSHIYFEKSTFFEDISVV